MAVPVEEAIAALSTFSLEVSSISPFSLLLNLETVLTLDQ